MSSHPRPLFNSQFPFPLLLRFVVGTNRVLFLDCLDSVCSSLENLMLTVAAINYIPPLSTLRRGIVDSEYEVWQCLPTAQGQ